MNTKLLELEKLIGNTPLVKIELEYKGRLFVVYAKLEYYNLTGSIKDRMALYILKQAYLNGDIKPGDEISEATSGNTGISFSAIGSYLGHKINIFMPNWMSEERKSLIKSFGANVIEVSKEQGGFLGSIQMANDYAIKGNVFLPHQFENTANVIAHYTATAPEIYNQMSCLGVKLDGFIAGVGTGGTVMGVGKYLKEQNPNCKVFPLEPANSPTMTTGGKKIGSHRIQGISDEFIPDIVKLDELDNIVSIDDGDAIIMSQMLAKTFGLGVGISSGANLLGAIKVQTQYGVKNVATVFPDDNKKYLSTDYSKTEPIKDNHITKDIRLLRYFVVI